MTGAAATTTTRKGSRPKASKKKATKDKSADAPVTTEPASTKKLSALGDGDDDDDDAAITELSVNEKFAKGYLERKRKEELTRLEKSRAYLEDDESDESESETEDEDGEQLTADLDKDIKKTLALIRKRDPIIYDKSVAFFKGNDGDGDDDDEQSGSDSDADAAEQRSKGRHKATKADAPLYYKDLVRQQVIAGDMADSDEDDDAAPVVTYKEEQAQLKRDFLKSLKEADGSEDDGGSKDDDGDDDDDDDLEGGLFSIRAKSEAEQQQEEQDYEEFRSKYGSSLKKDELDPEAFLENYLAGGWKEKKQVIPHYEDIVKEDEEDAEELDRMEEFEHTYNFRFEEEGSGMIQTYSRNIEDSMRRKDDTRKRKREERKERKALERLKKEEELKRLKNLKQAEIQSKLERIAKLMGKVSEEDRLQALSKDLEGDFDPEEYDKRMQQIFDEEYYNEDDDEMEKPTWDEEEDKELFAGLPVDEEEEEDESENENEESRNEEGNDDEPRVNIIDHEDDDDETMEDEDDEDDEAVDGVAEPDEEEWKRMTPEELKAAKQKYLDELYSLDYEDLIGDIKCRFKYRQVEKNDFGLTADEILAADDKELKQLVSLKRMAPYLEEEYNVSRRKVKHFKRLLSDKQREEAEQKQKKSKHKNKKTEDAMENEAKAVADESSAATQTKKRKRNKKTKAVSGENEDGGAAVANSAEMTENTEATPEVAQEPQQPPKKKSRRGRKKGTETNAFASTGLSSSRLESYKLLKSKKK